MNKIAYLIIAHDNFGVLKKLIEELDDPRNDIYLHIDKKVNTIFDVDCKFSKLICIKDRVDVRWGSYSQIACEFVLFEEVLRSKVKYIRLNLISGTHYPLKSQDEIYNFFASLGNIELLSFMYTNDYELNFKLGYYHYFLKNYHNGSKCSKAIAQKMWQFCIKFQKIFKIGRPLLKVSRKANNWVSVTYSAAEYIVSQKSLIESRFKNTFCGDEFFIPYLLENNSQYHIKNEPRLLYNDFAGGSNPKILKVKDYEDFMNSCCYFGRKFTDGDLNLLNIINSGMKNDG